MDGVKPATLDILAELEQEMVREGRTAEAAALREARYFLSGVDPGFLTLEEAAERLGVSRSAVERGIERGALVGLPKAEQWLVAAESVKRLLRLREALQELDQEGDPTDEEIAAMHSRPLSTSECEGVPASPP